MVRAQLFTLVQVNNQCIVMYKDRLHDSKKGRGV